MSSFFLKKKPKELRKRKQKDVGGDGTKKKQIFSNHKTGQARSQLSISKRPLARDDEEIASDDDENDFGTTENVRFSTDDDEETPQDKRLRLAKQYLEEIEREESRRAQDNEASSGILDGDSIDPVRQRLHKEYLDSVGKLRKCLAKNISQYDEDKVQILKHKKQHLPLSTVALAPDEQFLYSGGKSHYVLKWNLETLKVVGIMNVKEHREEPHNPNKRRRSNIVAISISSDFKFMALSDGGKNIQVWCPQSLTHLKTLSGHRDVVTGLIIPKDSHNLYSVSMDRAVKIWSLDEMAYVESLFGHQAGVTSIDVINREKVITSGGVDCSVRIWKVTEESQLIYNGHRGGVEMVKCLNDENFVSGGEDGSLCLWSALKKKPLFIQPLAHGKQANDEANWITALSCVPNTDLIASGSCDGFIRLWQVSEGGRKLKETLKLPLAGFINSLCFNAHGSKLYAAVSQEHHLGRWWRIKEAKNKIVIIDLSHNMQEPTSSSR